MLTTLYFDRNLTISYEGIYFLSISLPYPVYDKKGSAKYDKKNKTLTVTLPVQPIIIEASDNKLMIDKNDETENMNSDANTVGNASGDVLAKENNSAEISRSRSHVMESVKKEKKSESIHSRWISNDNSTSKDTVGSTSESTEGEETEESLAEKVRKGAEEALKRAAAQKANADPLPNTANASTSANSPEIRKSAYDLCVDSDVIVEVRYILYVIGNYCI